MFQWKKVNESGFYGATGGGVYKKDVSVVLDLTDPKNKAKKLPPKRNISDLP